MATERTEKSHPAFPDYDVVNSQIYVRPSDSPDSIPASSPTIIILYCWGDSNPKHVAKYTDGYRQLYPLARLVVVFGPILRAITQTLPQRAQTMAPVVDAVFGGSEDTAAHARERVMVVCMSNTGGINFASTLHVYHARFGVPMPYRLLVCDSCPGNTEFFRNIAPWSRAMALGTAKFFPWPFVVTQGLAVMFLAGIHGLAWVTGNQSAAEFSVNAVNDPELSVKSAGKLYLYSSGDDIISHTDIEEHAADARTRGYDVVCVPFDDAPHVGHMRVHPEKYWGAITSRWKELSDN
ncbi:DUF829-domain-containing protein [Coniochaeta ligniaria NRRL 30616]|uniref:DUF829-domain-containing protein n=1 Tax=Coniochaeta ligniaria NRRL 30616 TaxID=1408157 RepID=A0A1J7J4V9_9PEZI|nr:DUF829-domain-containing protein [Coniochaeta ligniaria NRRL 30616]